MLVEGQVRATHGPGRVTRGTPPHTDPQEIINVELTRQPRGWHVGFQAIITMNEAGGPRRGGGRPLAGC